MNHMDAMASCIRPLGFASVMLVLGCTSPKGVGAPLVSPRPTPQRWLMPDATRAQAAGADPARILVAEAGAVGDRFSSVVEVDDRDCLLVMARASEKVADLDLYVYSEDGTVLDVNDRPDAKPSILICPPHPRHIYVTARIATGQGTVAVGAHRVALDRSNPVRHSLQLGSGQKNSEQSDVPQPDLEARVLTHHQAIGGKWITVAQSAITVDSRVPTVSGLLIQDNTCLDMLVVPSPQVFALDIELVDSNGRTLGRAPVADRERWLIACSHERRSVTLQIRPHEGYGSVVLLISRGTLEMGRSTRRAIELGDSQPLETLVAEKHKALELLGYPHPNTVSHFWIERGFEHRLFANNDRGCTRFDIFSGTPSSGVQARIYTPNGDLLTSDGDLQHFPMLACMPGKFTLVIEAIGRGGPLLVEQRPETAKNPNALSFPRAAARSFKRAWNLGLAQSFGQLTSLDSIFLVDERAWEREITLDPAECMAYFMALDGDASGVELRIIDVETGEIVGGEQHPDAAHAELCAPTGQKRHTYRLRATVQSGRSPALLSAIKE
jgi:hypothetical protein